MSERSGVPEHGGNLEALIASRGLAAPPLLDFSANINPLGPPEALLAELRAVATDREDVMRYPEPSYRRLREAIASAHDLDPEAVVVGNGSAALLDAAIAALGVERALVPTPAFSEYRRALASRGAAFVAAPLDRACDFALDTADLIARARALDTDCIVLNTPHNPSGASLTGRATRAFVDVCEGDGRSTIVDEAFVDYIERESIVRHAAQTSQSVVLRSLTKFFAVPALRVGFAVATPDVARRMRAALPSWPVTSIAARAIAAALGDERYAMRTRDANAAAREHLRSDLASIGLRSLASAANYVLVEVPPPFEAAVLTKRLVDEYAIVVRDCTSYDELRDGRFVRIAVRSANDNARLVAALRNSIGAR
jgi:threonine-phosphate decarboxylase